MILHFITAGHTLPFLLRTSSRPHSMKSRVLFSGGLRVLFSPQVTLLLDLNPLSCPSLKTNPYATSPWVFGHSTFRLLAVMLAFRLFSFHPHPPSFFLLEKIPLTLALSVKDSQAGLAFFSYANTSFPMLGFRSR